MYNIIKNFIKTKFSTLTLQEKKGSFSKFILELINSANSNGYEIPNDLKITFSNEIGTGYIPENTELVFNEYVLDNPLSQLGTIFHEFRHLCQAFEKPEPKTHSIYVGRLFGVLSTKLINNYAPADELKSMKKETDKTISTFYKKYPTFKFYNNHFSKYYLFQDYEIDARQYSEKQLKNLLNKILKDNDFNDAEKYEYKQILNPQIKKEEKRIKQVGIDYNFDIQERELIKQQTIELINNFFSLKPRFFEDLTNSPSITFYYYETELDFLSQAAMFLNNEEKIIQKIFNGFLMLKNCEDKDFYLSLIYEFCQPKTLIPRQEKELKKLVGEETFRNYTKIREAINKHLNSLINNTIIHTI